jgi:hypothetical protein
VVEETQIEPISGKYSWLKLTLCLAAIVALGTYSDYKEFIYFSFNEKIFIILLKK